MVKSQECHGESVYMGSKSTQPGASEGTYRLRCKGCLHPNDAKLHADSKANAVGTSVEREELLRAHREKDQARRRAICDRLTQAQTNQQRRP